MNVMLVYGETVDGTQWTTLTARVTNIRCTIHAIAIQRCLLITRTDVLFCKGYKSMSASYGRRQQIMDLGITLVAVQYIFGADRGAAQTQLDWHHTISKCVFDTETCTRIFVATTV